MNEQQMEQLLEVLNKLVKGDHVPTGFEALAMTIGHPQIPNHDVTSALQEIAAGLHDVAEAIRETGNPTLN